MDKVNISSVLLKKIKSRNSYSLSIIFIFIVNCILLTANCFSQPVTQEWVRRYSGIYIPPNSNGGAIGKSVKLDSLGNVYVFVGEAIWDSAFGAKGVFGVLKYSSSGSPIWSTYYSTPGNVSDASVAFAVSKGGDVYITGYTGINFNYYITTVKFDSAGVLKWTRIFNLGGIDDEPNDIALDNAGNVVVVGATALSSSNANALTIKYNSNGDSLWVRKFSQFYYSSNYRVVIDDSNSIYTVGDMGNSSTESDYLILKYNKNGNFLWYTTYNSPQNYSDFGHAIAVDLNRNVYAVGTTYIVGSMLNNTLIRVSAYGVIQWARIFTGILSGNGRCQYPKGIAVTQDGGSIYYTTFCVNGMGGGGYDIVTLKYNSVGDTQWVRRYGGGVFGTPNEPAALRLDNYNNIYMTGTAFYQTSGDDYVTIKYLPDGTQKWLITYNGPLTNSEDLAHDFFIDSNLIYVTGASSRQNSPYFYLDATTIKYSQLVGIKSLSNEVPFTYSLSQNYPNPFNPVTKIKFDVSSDSGFRGNDNVTLMIYDVLGREIAVLVNQQLEPGTYEVDWDGTNYPSGVYFYRLSVYSSYHSKWSDEWSETKKMVLMK